MAYKIYYKNNLCKIPGWNFASPPVYKDIPIQVGGQWKISEDETIIFDPVEDGFSPISIALTSGSVYHMFYYNNSGDVIQSIYSIYSEGEPLFTRPNAEFMRIYKIDSDFEYDVYSQGPWDEPQAMRYGKLIANMVYTTDQNNIKVWRHIPKIPLDYLYINPNTNLIINTTAIIWGEVNCISFVFSSGDESISFYNNRVSINGYFGDFIPEQDDYITIYPISDAYAFCEEYSSSIDSQSLWYYAQRELGTPFIITYNGEKWEITQHGEFN